MRIGAPHYLEFVHTKLFERARKNVLSDEDVRIVEQALLENPRAGDVVRGTGGIRRSVQPVRAAESAGAHA